MTLTTDGDRLVNPKSDGRNDDYDRKNYEEKNDSLAFNFEEEIEEHKIEFHQLLGSTSSHNSCQCWVEQR